MKRLLYLMAAILVFMVGSIACEREPLDNPQLDEQGNLIDKDSIQDDDI